MSLPEQSQPERHDDDVLEQGDHQGKRDDATTPGAPLNSAGAWRIKAVQTPPPTPQAQPMPQPEPGDFTRMFELRQAPEPAPLPPSRPAQTAPTSQPGEFTRAFQRPTEAPLSVPEAASTPGQAGDFTRMFQTTKPESVPLPPVTVSELSEPGIEAPPAVRTRIYNVYIVFAIVLLCAIAVFVLVRLY